MPDKKTSEEIAETIIRRQKEQELEAKAEELKKSQQERLDAAKERIRARREAKEEKTYTVQAGDTLGKIAQKFYQDGNRWKEIFEANKDQIADPNAIHVGQTLVIP